ncbi:MAG: hypothetical protein HY241_00835 [Actinobacteria bacterium]|nr:hypothetical protein [Actinomycetota bacterium]
MTWTWRYLDAAGVALDRPETESFTNQSDAESWLGEHWRELHADGVLSVVLLRDDQKVYGPMSLEPA